MSAPKGAPPSSAAAGGSDDAAGWGAAFDHYELHRNFFARKLRPILLGHTSFLELGDLEERFRENKDEVVEAEYVAGEKVNENDLFE